MSRNVWPVCEQHLDIRYLHRLFRRGPRNNHRENIPLGSLSSVLQVEETAVLRRTELLLPKNIKRRRIRICCDSRVATAALLLLLYGPRAYAPDAPQPCRLIVLPSYYSSFLTSPLSLLVRPPRPCNPRDSLVAKGGTAWARIMAGNFA